MKKFLLLPLAILLSAGFCFAQEDEDEQEEVKYDRMIPQNTFVPRRIIKDKKPVIYPVPRESDVIWSKRVWRIIDCREKINYPLYFPTTDLEYRKSLVQTLVDGIRSGAVQAYDTDTDEFTTMLTKEEVLGRFDASDRMVTQEKIDGTGDTTILIKGQINWEEVRQFEIKEEWYFDAHYSQMYARIVGICPIRVYNKRLNVEDEEGIIGQEAKTKLFWVYFPEARRVLANSVCFAGDNELAQISFDDLLHKRRFNSYIVAATNSLNDRRIDEYARSGFEAIMESNRIKNEIMNFESDLWEY